MEDIGLDPGELTGES